jgi:hypothetical protein
MRLLEVVDLADMFRRTGKFEDDSPAVPAGRKPSALIRVRFSHQAKNPLQARIGPPCVIVVDVGGEEFEVARTGLVAEA